MAAPAGMSPLMSPGLGDDLSNRAGQTGEVAAGADPITNLQVRLLSRLVEASVRSDSRPQLLDGPISTARDVGQRPISPVARFR